MLECGGQKAAKTSLFRKEKKKKKQINQKESNKAQRERKVYVLNVKRSLRTNVCGRKNLPSERDLTLQEAYILERERSKALDFSLAAHHHKRNKQRKYNSLIPHHYRIN